MEHNIPKPLQKKDCETTQQWEEGSRWETEHKYRHHSLRTSSRTALQSVLFLDFDTVQTCDSQRYCVLFLFKPKWWLLHPLKGRRILVGDPERSLCQKLKLRKHRSSLLVPYLFSGPVGLCLSCFSGFRDPVQGPVQARQEFSPPAPTCTANPSCKKWFSHCFIYCGRWRSEDSLKESGRRSG